MEFRVQTGRPSDSGRIQGVHDIAFEAIDFADVKGSASIELLSRLWVEQGEWARVIGHGQERRLSFK